ncbi:MAG: right-handed parallel beta-helix repeat-containing protein [Armatimonadetes bacterium]|nr:right-handed parallel beta-helix repeat-containing protein [Armatimonadota bacterium]
MQVLLWALILWLLCFASCMAQPAAPAQIHVARDGDDANPGTEERPLATLAGARDAVRKLKQVGLTAPVEVLVHGGTYYLAEPLVLGPEDSGTPDCPITWRAAEGEEVVISGGAPITGWHKGDGDVWAAPAPEGLDFRILRVGERWAIRARYPNFDPANPRTGGWLFADFGGEPWERGAFNTAVQNVHNVGDRLTWRFRAPANGLYRVWLRYAHKMTDYNVADMGGRTAIRLDDEDWEPLMHLPDTGGWDRFRWAHVCDLRLRAGERTLQWTNQQGGGLALDAIALCDDADWDPNEAMGQPTWWGAVDFKPPAEGRHLIIIQCEAVEKAEGPEVVVPGPTPPGTVAHMRFRAGDMPQFADLRGAEVHIFIAWGWVNAIVPVDRIDYADRKIMFTAPGAAQDVRVGNRYFIENVREALDAPGEWYLDRDRGQVLYIPDAPDFSNQPVVAARLGSLICLEGDMEAGRFVEYVNIEGFRFRDTTYAVTRDYYTPQDAAVVLSAARNCTIRRCDFAWLGGYGVKLANRAEQCVIRESHFHDLGQGGVILVGGTAIQPHHCAILGNVMERLGLIYKHVAGVYMVHGSDNRVAYNRITDVPRYAVSCKSQGEERLSHRNVIEYNEFIRTNLETNDTGAFESLGYEHRDSGNVVRYNLILDSVGMGTTPEGQILTPYFTWGVYLDDYSSGTTVFGNIVARTQVGGVCIHGGQNNVIQNNIFVEGHEHQVRLQPRDDFMKGNRFVNNIVVYSRPEAQVIFSWWYKPDALAECDRNLYYLRGGDLAALDARIMPAGTWQEWLEAGFDRNSIVADPLFVDPDNDDYRLRPESPAWKLGFQPIPAERIGPKGLAMEEAGR